MRSLLSFIRPVRLVSDSTSNKKYITKRRKHNGFRVYQKEFELQSRGWIPTFHDVSKEIREIVAASSIKNGMVCVVSHHTTCSVMVQECSHDIDSFDLKFLQYDLLDIMKKLVPDFKEEHQYRFRSMHSLADMPTSPVISPA